MLKRAGFAVATGNAHPSLKEEGDFVTSSDDQEGILQAVRRILDLGGESR
ncbi:MAG TPA: hypothetical protein DDZ66_09830 [Firmicutes bacterium]|jgi:hydroxymethylpyrimidine pyrophosphatase-like HAD family hydrolase|nr:hypothetical protein [Bacillota bacterium]